MPTEETQDAVEERVNNNDDKKGLPNIITRYTHQRGKREEAFMKKCNTKKIQRKKKKKKNGMILDTTTT